MSSDTRPDWAGRIRVLAAQIVERELDALVVSHLVNIQYLTGFVATAGLAVVVGDDLHLLADGRYVAAARQAQARGELGPVQLAPVESRYHTALAELLERLGVSRVGFEAGHVTVATLQDWQQLMPTIRWDSTDGVIERQRLIKDPLEIAILRQAARLLSDVARDLPRWVTAGRTERLIARDIDAALDRAGFSAPAFPTIVAGGPNSALPHARPGDRPLAAGDLVVLDFGGVLDGYCVDLTRMAGVGRLSAQAESLVASVRAAQDAAIAAVRAGQVTSVVDAAARGTLEARGLGPAFPHSTGHGLGLEVHEAPRLARAESGAVETLQAGMVCTIEPGAYLEGLGGVRLEDDILVTADGCEVLTDAPRDLLAV
jgi:Xaa-Pro aminopeptidase